MSDKLIEITSSDVTIGTFTASVKNKDLLYIDKSKVQVDEVCVTEYTVEVPLNSAITDNYNALSKIDKRRLSAYGIGQENGKVKTDPNLLEEFMKRIRNVNGVFSLFENSRQVDAFLTELQEYISNIYNN